MIICTWMGTCSTRDHWRMGIVHPTSSLTVTPMLPRNSERQFSLEIQAR